MKFNFRLLLLKLIAKIVPRSSLEYVFRRGIEIGGVQRGLEKLSDEDIERGIEEIKEGSLNTHGLDEYLSAMAKQGVTLDALLEQLETEKFLREHRRKYHPDEI